MSLSPASQEKICTYIVDAFSIDALKALTRFRLGFNLEKYVEIKALDATVLALLEYTLQCGTTRTLLGACISLRPEREDMAKDFNRILADELGGPIRDADLMVRQIVQGINGVNDLRGANPEVLQAVEEVKDRLADLKRGIDLLRAYKSLHDGLHLLQMGLRRLSNAARNLGKNPALLIDLQESIADMRSLETRAVPEVAALPPNLRGTENGWLERLKEAIVLAQKEITHRDSINGRRCIMGVQGILRQHAPRINTEIVQACEALEIEALRELFRKTSDHDGIPAERKNAFLAARDSAASVVVEIAALVGQHNQWQWIDQYLWQMADCLPQDGAAEPADFDASYISVQEYLKDLVGAEPTTIAGGDPPWFIKLPAMQSEMEVSRKAGDWPLLLVNFTSFRFEAICRFVAVDSTLKTLATRVADIGASLEQLID